LEFYRWRKDDAKPLIGNAISESTKNAVPTERYDGIAYLEARVPLDQSQRCGALLPLTIMSGKSSAAPRRWRCSPPAP
jgi:hypothetical protein